VEGLTSNHYSSRRSQRAQLFQAGHRLRVKPSPFFGGLHPPEHSPHKNPRSIQDKRSLWQQAYHCIFPSVPAYLGSLPNLGRTHEQFQQIISEKPDPLPHAAGIYRLCCTLQLEKPADFELLYRLCRQVENGSQLDRLSRQIKRLYSKELIAFPSEFLQQVVQVLETTSESVESVTEALLHWPPPQGIRKKPKPLFRTLLRESLRLSLQDAEAGDNKTPESIQDVLAGTCRQYQSFSTDLVNLKNFLDEPTVGKTPVNELFSNILAMSRNIKDRDELLSLASQRFKLVLGSEPYGRATPRAMAQADFLYRLCLQSGDPEHLAVLLDVLSPRKLFQIENYRGAETLETLEQLALRYKIPPDPFYQQLFERAPSFLENEVFLQLLKDFFAEPCPASSVYPMVQLLATATASIQNLPHSEQETLLKRLVEKAKTDSLQVLNMGAALTQMANPHLEVEQSLWQLYLATNMDEAVMENLQGWFQQEPVSQLPPSEQALFLNLLTYVAEKATYQPEALTQFFEALSVAPFNEKPSVKSFFHRLKVSESLAEAGLPVHEVFSLLQAMRELPPVNQTWLAKALSTPPLELDPDSPEKNRPLRRLSKKAKETHTLLYNLNLNLFRHGGHSSAPLDSVLLAETVALLKNFPNESQFYKILQALNTFGHLYPDIRARLKLFASLDPLPSYQQYQVATHLEENLLSYTRLFPCSDKSKPFTESQEFQEFFHRFLKSGNSQLITTVAKAATLMEDRQDFLTFAELMAEQPEKIRRQLFPFIRQTGYGPRPLLAKTVQGKHRVLDIEKLKAFIPLIATFPEEFGESIFPKIPETIPSIEHWKAALEVFLEAGETLEPFYQFFKFFIPGLRHQYQGVETDRGSQISVEALRAGLQFLISFSQPTALLNQYLMHFEKIPIDYVKELYCAVEYRIPIHTGKELLPELTAIIPLYLKQVMQQQGEAELRTHANQVSGGLTRIYDYIGGETSVRDIEPLVLDTWSRLGTLGLSFSKWRFDTMGRWKGHGPMAAASLFELSGLFQKMPPRRNDERYHGGYYLNVPDKQLSIELRRSYIVISSAEHGTLVIRNSSPLFGRDLLPEMANFLPGHYYPLPESPLNPGGHVKWESETSVFAKMLHSTAQLQKENHSHMQALLNLFDEAMTPYVQWKCGFNNGTPPPGFNQLLRVALLSAQNGGSVSPFGKQKNLRLAWVDPFGLPNPIQTLDLSQPNAQKEVAFYLNGENRQQSPEVLQANLPTLLPFLSEGLSKGWELILAPEIP